MPVMNALQRRELRPQLRERDDDGRLDGCL
jgi:hypothetical protein